MVIRKTLTYLLHFCVLGWYHDRRSRRCRCMCFVRNVCLYVQNNVFKCLKLLHPSLQPFIVMLLLLLKRAVKSLCNTTMETIDKLNCSFVIQCSSFSKSYCMIEMWFYIVSATCTYINLKIFSKISTGLSIRLLTWMIKPVLSHYLEQFFFSLNWQLFTIVLEVASLVSSWSHE